MFLLSQIKESLIGMCHGGTLNKIRNQEALFERAASNFLLKCKPLETMRTAALSQTIHDDVYNYPLPSDYFSLIDLIPQDDRGSWDNAYRKNASEFDLTKAIKEKTVSIEGSEGSKIIRINWRSMAPKTIHTMNSLTANGTWSAVGTATGLKANEIFKISGSASIEFDLVTTGDGIQNTTMTAVDLTDEDETGSFFVWVYLSSAPTSISLVWGNDLTTAYWTSTAQTTQADGTAFKVGYNLLRFAWGSATETGTVAPATIDSVKLTIANATALSNVRVDNIVCSNGRNFDMKYYGKYFFKNSAGTYLSRPASDDDYVLVDNDSLPLYLYECLVEMAQQMEGTDSVFDMSYAEKKLSTLYPHFRSEYQDQRKKTIMHYGGKPRFNH
jgi:hypothetical protein